jgi:hypothetical protein
MGFGVPQPRLGFDFPAVLAAPPNNPFVGMKWTQSGGLLTDWFWDGARWLSVHQSSLSVSQLNSFSTPTSIPFVGAPDRMIWIERMMASWSHSEAVSPGGAVDSISNYWEARLMYATASTGLDFTPVRLVSGAGITAPANSNVYQSAALGFSVDLRAANPPFDASIRTRQLYARFNKIGPSALTLVFPTVTAIFRQIYSP